MCCPGIYVRLRNGGSNRESTGESAGLRKHLDKMNRGSEERNMRTESGSWSKGQF